MSSDLEKSLKLLEESYHFPTDYRFKFIVPATEVNQLLLVLNVDSSGVDIKPSKKGNYLSVTFKKKVNEALEIIQLYQDVAAIKGIVCL